MVRRIVATLAIFGLGSVAFAVLAQDDISFSPDNPPDLRVSPAPTKVESITFTAVKTDKGSEIQVTAGDVSFTVPSFKFAAGKSAIQKVTVENGVLVVHTEGATLECPSMTMKLHNKAAEAETGAWLQPPATDPVTNGSKPTVIKIEKRDADTPPN